MKTKKNSKSGLFGSAANICFSLFNEAALLQIKLPENFTLTAHTGCEGTKDNSLDSITVAVVAGADIVEFDLNFDNNGTAVLSHDEPDGKVFTLKEAFELLKLYKSLKINIDVKSTFDLKQVVGLSEEYGLSDRIFFTGVTADFVDAVKESAPGVVYYLNKDIELSKINDEEYISTLIEEVTSLGACGLNINYRRCSAKMVELFHKNSLQVSVWTVNNRFDMKKVLKLGVDNITTRKPTEYRKLIDSVKGE